MITQVILAFWAFFATALSENVQSTHSHGIVVYWGQNSGTHSGSDQKPLRHYCDKKHVDIVVISYLNEFPEMRMNLANMCWDTFSSGLLKCPDVGKDITYCQEQGKIVLLSLGGDLGNYKFEDDKEARDFAQVLYNTFGPGEAKERPFGNAVVNGYDLNLEKQSPGYAALATELNRLHKDMDIPYFLTATPQCPYPDENLKEALLSAPFHAVFIQFYNNNCGLIHPKAFNFMTKWKDFADNISLNKDVLLFIGLPGASESAGSGYATLEQVKAVVTKDFFEYEKFGGFMLWDASSSEGNKDAQDISYDEQLANFLAAPHS
ncbi:hypothetical protein OXX79_003156 [Metschnikowia pulcherrima]